MQTTHTLNQRPKIALGQLAQYFLLSIGGFMMVFPYLWMLSTSFKARGTWYNLSLIPQQFSFEHYDRLLSTSLLPRWYLNSLIVATVSTVSVVFFSTLAGFAFSKYKFRGREAIFLMILATIMIPSEIMIIPWYVGIAKVGWIDKIRRYPDAGDVIGIRRFRDAPVYRQYPG